MILTSYSINLWPRSSRTLRSASEICPQLACMRISREPALVRYILQSGMAWVSIVT